MGEEREERVISRLNLEIALEGHQKVTQELKDIQNKVEGVSTESEGAVASVSALEKILSRLHAASTKFEKSFGSATRKIGNIILWRTVRTAMSSVSKSFDESTKKIYEFSRAYDSIDYDNQLDRISTNMQYIGNLVASVFTPLYGILANFLDWFSNALANVVSTLSKAFNILAGNDYYLGVNKVFVSMAENSETASKNIQKMLFGFDEINRLNAVSSGGASSTSGGSPFERIGLDKSTNKVKDALEELDKLPIWAKLGGAIGFGTALVGIITKIGTKLGSWGAIALEVMTLLDAIEQFGNGVNVAWGTVVQFDSSLALLGLTFTILTGTWIPLAIMGIAGFVATLGIKGDEIVGLLDRLQNWIDTTFRSDFSATLGGLGDILDAFADLGIDVSLHTIDAFKGITTFLRGSFLGDSRMALDGLQQIGVSAVNGILDIVNFGVNGLVGFVNSFIDAINSVSSAIARIFGIETGQIAHLSTVKLELVEDYVPETIKQNGNGKKTYSIRNMTYANGGFPEDGLFFANHNELVGQFSNGNTAVANNMEIIEGIKQGVIEAMQSVGSNDISIYVDGQRLFDVVVDRHNKQVMRTGMTPLRV